MRVVRYILVGGIAASVDILLFLGAVKGLGFNWFFSGLTSFVFATAINYSLSIRYVFTSGIKHKKKQK